MIMHVTTIHDFCKWMIKSLCINSKDTRMIAIDRRVITALMRVRVLGECGVLMQVHVQVLRAGECG